MARRAAEQIYKDSRKNYIKVHWKKAGDKPFNKDHWRFLDTMMGRKVRKRVEPKCSPDALNDAFLMKVHGIRAPL